MTRGGIEAKRVYAKREKVGCVGMEHCSPCAPERLIAVLGGGVDQKRDGQKARYAIM